MRALFYDTWAFAALANAADPNHPASVDADRAAEDKGYVMVTSDYVLDETLTLLHVSAGARVALDFADLLLDRVKAAETLLVDVTLSRRLRALEMFRRVAPEERRLSFTDCTSFVVMHELEIEVAFTADRHFHRAGQGVRPLFDRTRRGLRWHLDD